MKTQLTYQFPTDGSKSLAMFATREKNKSIDKKSAKEALKAGIQQLRETQAKLYAHDRYSVLIIFQAMDAAGKDGTIKHVMSGVNPQGCRVNSFRAPSAQELDHDYLWRCVKVLPARGMIGIFNRSYYEEVLVVRVHPAMLAGQKIVGIAEKGPPVDDFWLRRFEEINNFERYLARNQTVVIKFFLNVSREEQKNRFLDRIEQPDKNWKFSMKDVEERQHWASYMHAYGDMLQHTSTEQAPWYVVPADQKWYMRAAVMAVLVERLSALNLNFPEISAGSQAALIEAKRLLENE
jgi:PPK2 family polyphosphate:nucleotide phosphotransferase